MKKLLIILLGGLTLILSASVLILFAYEGMTSPRWEVGNPDDFANFSVVISGTLGTLLLAITALFVFETVAEMKVSNLALTESTALQSQSIEESRAVKSLEALTQAMNDSKSIVQHIDMIEVVSTSSPIKVRVRALVRSSNEDLTRQIFALEAEGVSREQIMSAIEAYLGDLFYTAGLACKYLQKSGEYFLFRPSIDNTLSQLEELTASHILLLKHFPDLYLLNYKQILPFKMMQNQLEAAQDSYLDDMLKSIGIVSQSGNEKP